MRQEMPTLGATMTLTADLQLPTAASAQSLLRLLVGQEFTLRACKEPLCLTDRPAVITHYSSPLTSRALFLVADLGFAACAAGALALSPPASVASARSNGRLEGELKSTYEEVVDVMSRLLGLEAVTIEGSYDYPVALPARVVQGLSRPSARVDFRSSMVHYGEGQFAFVVG